MDRVGSPRNGECFNLSIGGDYVKVTSIGEPKARPAGLSRPTTRRFNCLIMGRKLKFSPCITCVPEAV